MTICDMQCGSISHKTSYRATAFILYPQKMLHFVTEERLIPVLGGPGSNLIWLELLVIIHVSTTLPYFGIPGSINERFLN